MTTPNDQAPNNPPYRGIRGDERKRKIRLLIARDGDACRYCHVPFSEELRRTIDHVRPRVFGGSNALENLALACGPCNEARGCGTRAFRKELV